jgi:hypothetical protein
MYYVCDSLMPIASVWVLSQVACVEPVLLLHAYCLHVAWPLGLDVLRRISSLNLECLVTIFQMFVQECSEHLQHIQ